MKRTERQTILRSAVLALVAALLPATPSPAQTATTYPARPLTLLVGYAAGTGVDTTTRFYAERIREATGQAVTVVNKPGANGNLAALDAVRAAADGYTILVTPNGTITTNQYLLKKMPFDAGAELTPVATIARWGAILLVNPRRLPVSSVAELTARMKAQPGGLNFGSGNFTGHAAGQLYAIRAGVSAAHVPYKSVPAALTDLLGGQIDFMFADIVTGLPHAQSGRLRALAVTTPRRLSNAPAIPTMVEAGVTDYELVNWFGVFLPARAPEPVVRRLAELFDGITVSTAAKEFYARVGGEPFSVPTDAMHALIERDSLAWGRLVKAAGIEPE